MLLDFALRFYNQYMAQSDRVRLFPVVSNYTVDPDDFPVFDIEIPSHMKTIGICQKGRIVSTHKIHNKVAVSIVITDIVNATGHL
jgi:hypothetical protein